MSSDHHIGSAVSVSAACLWIPSPLPFWTILAGFSVRGCVYSCSDLKGQGGLLPSVYLYFSEKKSRGKWKEKLCEVGKGRGGEGRYWDDKQMNKLINETKINQEHIELKPEYYLSD